MDKMKNFTQPPFLFKQMRSNGKNAGKMFPDI